MRCILVGHVPVRHVVTRQHPSVPGPPLGATVTLCLHCGKELALETDGPERRDAQEQRR